MNFTLVSENLIEEYDEAGIMEMVADPVAIVLEDGRIRLVIMRQEIGVPKPVAAQNGEILTYISEDGVNFEFESSVAKWDDFEEWEVYSLNDPKIMELDDGRFRVYVAALIPDPEFVLSEGQVLERGSKEGFKWILVSITTE